MCVILYRRCIGIIVLFYISSTFMSELLFFFFKQKTAYELRISDWSSDVCSSDLLYAGGHDASDPELSPLYADCRGFPPMYLLASDSEVLLDDTVLFARRAKAAGVDVRFEIWPVLPHAFPDRKSTRLNSSH